MLLTLVQANIKSEIMDAPNKDGEDFNIIGALALLALTLVAVLASILRPFWKLFRGLFYLVFGFPIKVFF